MVTKYVEPELRDTKHSIEQHLQRLEGLIALSQTACELIDQSSDNPMLCSVAESLTDLAEESKKSIYELRYNMSPWTIHHT